MHTPSRLSGFVAGILLCTSVSRILTALNLFAAASDGFGRSLALVFALMPALLLFLAAKYFYGLPRRWVHTVAFVTLTLHSLSICFRLASLIYVAPGHRSDVVASGVISMLSDLALNAILIGVIARIRSSSKEEEPLGQVAPAARASEKII